MTTEEFWQCSTEPEEPSYTKDRFIELSKKALKSIEEAHASCWETPVLNFESMTDEEIESLPMCSTCNGTLYYNAGGNIEDCDRCHEGVEVNPVFNAELFAEKMQQIMFESDDPFFELLHCDINEDSAL